MFAQIRLRNQLLILALGAIALCGCGGGLLVAELFAVRTAAQQVIDVYTPTMAVADDVVRRLLEVERDVDDILDDAGTASEAVQNLQRDAAKEGELLRDLTARVEKLESLPDGHGLVQVTDHLRTLTREFTAFLVYARALASAPPSDSTWRSDFQRRRDALTDRAESIAAVLHTVREAAAARMEADTLRTVLIVTAAFVVVVVVAAVIATIMAQRVALPIEALAGAAERVRKGALDVEVVPAGSRETVRLGTAFNAMTEGLRQKERIKQTFGKYLDPRVVQRLLATDGENLAPQLARMTIGYVNMSGFIRRAESLPPGRLIAVLNAFLDAVAQPVSARGGVIDKTIGDTLMFVFGPPFGEAASQALLAVEAGLAQAQAVSALSARLPDFAEGDVRIGIATGPVLLGSMGAEMSRAYTVVGDAANIAARIERANRIYGTRHLIDGETRHAVPESIFCRGLDTVLLPGKSTPTELYEVIGPTDQVSGAQREFVRTYEAALVAWRGGGWAEARAGFEACASLNGSDVPTSVFLERLDLFVIAPPDRDWHGVWRLTDHQ